MKIQEILNEYQRVIIHPLRMVRGSAVTGNVAIFKNPSHEELLSFLEKDEVRGVLFNDALYIWPASVIHHGGVKLQFDEIALCDLYFSKDKTVWASEWQDHMRLVNGIYVGFNIYRSTGNIEDKAEHLLKRVLGINDIPKSLYENYKINSFNEIPTWYNVKTGENIQTTEDHLQELFDNPSKFGIPPDLPFDDDTSERWWEIAFKNGWVRIMFHPKSNYLGIQTSSKLSARKAAKWIITDSKYDLSNGLVIELWEQKIQKVKLNTIVDIEYFIKTGKLIS